jgi:hypothetical protein
MAHPRVMKNAIGFQTNKGFIMSKFQAIIENLLQLISFKPTNF